MQRLTWEQVKFWSMARKAKGMAHAQWRICLKKFSWSSLN
jgi:hypothetical protein